MSILNGKFYIHFNSFPKVTFKMDKWISLIFIRNTTWKHDNSVFLYLKEISSATSELNINGRGWYLDCNNLGMKQTGNTSIFYFP